MKAQLAGPITRQEVNAEIQSMARRTTDDIGQVIEAIIDSVDDRFNGDEKQLAQLRLDLLKVFSWVEKVAEHTGVRFT